MSKTEYTRDECQTLADMVKSQPAQGHTPGPWTVAAWMEGQHGLFMVSTAERANEVTDEGEPVGNLPIKSTQANARLIAAAPDLLAVAKEFVRVMENPQTTAAMPHTVAQARAAIAKAEGH